MGDRLELTDLEGAEYLAVIRGAQLSQTSDQDPILLVEAVEKVQVTRESPVRVTLFQGLPKQDKLEFIIQKAVELGAVRIVPVECDRSVARIRDDKDAAKKTERWNRIAYEAAKQSKRSGVPEVLAPVKLKALPELVAEGSLKLLAYEGEALKPLVNHLAGHPSEVAVMIGPEGGLTEKEIQTLTAMGFITVGLGPRILRTETAGLALISIVQYVLGDMGGNC